MKSRLSRPIRPYNNPYNNKASRHAFGPILSFRALIPFKTLMPLMAVMTLSSCITPPQYSGDWRSFVGHDNVDLCAQKSTNIAADDLPYYVISSRLPYCGGDKIALTLQRTDKVRYGRFNMIAEGRDFPKLDVLTASSQLRFEDENLWLRSVAAQAEANDGTAILYTHGYNESYFETAARIAKIQKVTQFKGPIIQFTWPSHRKILRYATDATNLELYKPQYSASVRKLASLPQVKSLILISHSLGGQLLLHTLEEIDLESARLGSAGPNLSRKLTNIILASPDIDKQIFERIASKNILNDSQIANGRRITVYGSAYDKAIRLSHVVNGYERLGGTLCDDPLTPVDTDLAKIDRKAKPRCYAQLPDDMSVARRDGLHIVDTSEVSNSNNGHSDFTGSPEACSDFVAVVRDKPLSNDGRRFIGQGNIWRLNAGVSNVPACIEAQNKQ